MRRGQGSIICGSGKVEKTQREKLKTSSQSGERTIETDPPIDVYPRQLITELNKMTRKNLIDVQLIIKSNSAARKLRNILQKSGLKADVLHQRKK